MALLKRASSGKSLLPLVLAAVAGIAVAAFSWYFLVKPPEGETVSVPVLAHDVPAYSQIAAEDLVFQKIPAAALDQGIAADPGQVVGKTAAVHLYKGEQIRIERIVPADNLGDRRIVAVGTDALRCAGGSIAAGNVVDVLLLSGPGVPPALLAADALVVEILDAQGNPVSKHSGLLQPGELSLPAMAVLAVRPGEVPQVARGAGEEAKNVVLVKKLVGGAAGGQ